MRGLFPLLTHLGGACFTGHAVGGDYFCGSVAATVNLRGMDTKKAEALKPPLCGKYRPESPKRLVAAIVAGLEGTGTTVRTEVTATATAAAHFFFGLGFVNRERTAIEVIAVQLFSSGFGFFSGAHGHESETAGAARFTIRGDENVGNAAELFEGRAEHVFGGLEGKISYV
jgi:hypothetical protein